MRELIADLERAEFFNRGGKGSHRNYKHPQGKKVVRLSGKTGNDAKPYQERDVTEALDEVKGK